MSTRSTKTRPAPLERLEAARIGILSDSHGRVGTTLRAARLLREEGAGLVLHLGDIGGPEVLDALVEGLEDGGAHRPPIRVVFGNIDRDRPALRRRCRELEIAALDPVGRLAVAGRTVVFLHGDSARNLEEALGEGVDYVCHGHTHQVRDERLGPTRVINPGALFRAGRYTIALLEVAGDRLRFIGVPRHQETAGIEGGTDGGGRRR